MHFGSGQNAHRQHSVLTMRGQGATEYMILLGAVLIIGLAVVSLLSFSSSTSKGISQSESQLYWQGSANPIRVIEAKAVGADRYLVVENANSEAITIDSIAISGATPSSWSGQVTLSSGGRSTITAKMSDSQAFGCYEAGKIVSESLKFYYSTPYLSGKVQTGQKDMAVPCSCIPNGQNGAVETCCSGAVVVGGAYPTCVCSDGFYPCISDKQCCTGLHCIRRPSPETLSYCE